MSKRISDSYLVSLVLLFNLPGFANSVSGTVTSSAKITVRAFKYTPISPETWQAAQNVATRILDRTGIETVWLDCSLAADGQHLIPDCALPATPTDIILRLVPTSQATRAHFGDATLGIAAPSEKNTTASASVFCDRVEKLSKGGHASLAVILGHAAAHEIGHLLLGSNSHSPFGLMRGSWSRQDLQRASGDDLLFTPSQGLLMRQKVLERSESAGTVPRSR